MCESGMLASADSSRMVISIWLISRLKITDVSPFLIDADRAMSRARVDFPTAGLCCNDHHLSGMQAIGQLVEIGEPGRYPGQPGATGLDGLHLIERGLHQLREGLVVLRHSSLGNRIHLGLGPIDDVVDIALRGVGHLSDPYRSLDQSAQDRLLVHDLGVVTSIGRHRNAREQRMQVRRATDAQQLAPLAQLVGNGYRISRLAASIEIDDGVIDLLVRRAVEVGTAQHLDDIGDGVLAHQHGAEHALLGFHILRRHTVGQRSVRQPSLVAVGRHHLGNTHPDSLQIRWTPPSPSDTRLSTNRIRVRKSSDRH